MNNRDVRLKVEVEYCMRKAGFNNVKLAREMHIDPSTLYRKLKNPAKLTVEELRFLHRRIGLSVKQIGAAL